MTRIRHLKLFQALGVLSLVLLIRTSCGGNGVDPSVAAAQFSRLTLVVTTDQARSHHSLPNTTTAQPRQVSGAPDFSARLEVSIEAPSMEPITHTFFLTEDQQTEVTVQLRVPKRKDREITMIAFNETGSRIFDNLNDPVTVALTQEVGSVTIMLRPTVTVPIQLVASVADRYKPLKM
jgi:hypothetical protein